MLCSSSYGKYCLSRRILVFFLVLTIAVTSSQIRPRESQAFLITGAIAGTIVLAGLISGAAMQLSICYYKNGGWPETKQEWDYFWLDMIEGTYKGGLFAVAGTVFAAMGSAAAAGKVGETSLFAIEKAIEGTITVAPISYDWGIAIGEVKEKKRILIENGINRFRHDNPTPTREEVALWKANPEVYFGPYFTDETEGYDEFVAAVEELDRQLGDWLADFGLPRDIYADLAVLAGGEIVETDNTGVSGVVTDKDSIRIKHTIDPHYTEVDNLPHNLYAAVVWKVFNYETSSWNIIDSRTEAISGSLWPAEIEFQSAALSGQALLIFAGIEAGDSRPVYIAPQWSTTVDTETRFSADLSKYNPESGILDDSPLILSLHVAPAPEIVVSKPVRDDLLEKNRPVVIEWDASPDEVQRVRIQLSSNGGSTWSTIVDSTENDGSYSWTVNGPVSTQCLIRVSSTDYPAIASVSAGYFSISEYCPDHDLSVSYTASSASVIRPAGSVDFSAVVTNHAPVAENNAEITITVVGDAYTTCSVSKQYYVPASSSINVDFNDWPSGVDWPSGCSAIVAGKHYAATISILSSADCDTDTRDNSGSSGVYVSLDGEAPSVAAYSFKKYSFSYYGSDIGDGMSETVDGTTFTLKRNGLATDGGYLLEVEGEGEQWYEREYSYRSSDNQLIWWYHEHEYDQETNTGRLVLCIGEADNSSAFSDYSLAVRSGGTVTFSGNQAYDASYAYRVTGDPGSGLTVNFTRAPEGSFSASGGAVSVGTAGLPLGIHKFAILSGSPRFSTYNYLAYGAFKVVPPTYTLDLQAEGSGQVLVTTSGSSQLYSLPVSLAFEAGTSIQLQAVGFDGFVFSSWTGDQSGTTNPRTFTISSDQAVNVHFQRLFTLQVAALGAGSGAVRVNGVIETLPYSGSHIEGSTVALRADAAAGSVFAKWSGDVSGNTISTSITVSGDKSVFAEFKQQHVISISIDPVDAGTVFVNGNALANGESHAITDGDTAYLYAAAVDNYQFYMWTGDIGGITSQRSVLMDRDIQVTARYFDKTGCVYHTVPDTISVPAAGGSGCFEMITACPYRVSAYEDWITILSGMFNPSGNFICYSISGNQSQFPRQGAISGSGFSVTVYQEGDETLCPVYYRDGDRDGYGDPNLSLQACSQPDGTVTDSTDCNDSDPLEHPGQEWLQDEDGDGYPSDAAVVIFCSRPAHHSAREELASLEIDNCPDIANPDQSDQDADGDGNACDPLAAVLGNITYDNHLDLEDCIANLQVVAGADTVRLVTTFDPSRNHRIDLGDALYCLQTVSGSKDISFYEPFNPDLGLVAYYPFNEDAADFSGNGFDGSIVHPSDGGIRFEQKDRFGEAGSAVRLSTATQYSRLDIGNHEEFTDLGNEFTISFWAMIDSYPYEGGIVLEHSQPAAGASANWTLGIVHTAERESGGKIFFSSGDETFMSENSLEYEETWFHVAVTRSKRNGEIKFYLNGRLDHVVTQHFNDLSRSTALNIGTTDRLDGSFDNNGFVGNLDELRVYNHVYTAAEIRELYTFEANKVIPLDPAAVDDAMVREMNPVTNFGHETVLRSGRSLDSGGDSQSYLRIESDVLPDNVSSATLRLTNSPQSNAESRGVLSVYQVLEPWDEGAVTWETRPVTSADPLHQVGFDNGREWVYVDISDTIVGWKTGLVANYGIMIDTDDNPGTGDGNLPGVFFSSDNGEEELLRPQLIVEFQPSLMYLDCSGQWTGSAYIDDCYTCVGGNTGLLPCKSETDDDGDGFTENQGDCDDDDPSINLAATELCGDGLDNDCSGSDLACIPTVTSAGQVWMDRNLGAERVATSFVDPEAYGGLFQWGRAMDGHENRMSSTTWTNSTASTPGNGSFILEDNFPYDWIAPQNAELWDGVSAENNPCPTGFRLPTRAEFETEIASWSSKDADGANASPLKLSGGGYRFFYDGTLQDVGDRGRYWTSDSQGVGSQHIEINSEGAFVTAYYRSSGYSVRCIMD